MRIRVLHLGLGPIGLAIARQVVERPGFQLAGAVDADAALAGRDVGALLGLPRPLRVRVTADLRKAIRASKPDAAVLCTSSSLGTAAPAIEEVLRHRIPVVTTTEEAAFPTRRNRAVAERLDAAAKQAGVALLGTGVNPGFVMDALPIALTAACERVDRVEVTRVQDARVRRRPFQEKIGAGLTPAEFQRRADRGEVRHVGFAESIRMIAAALGWRLDRVHDDVSPILAESPIESEFFAVRPGQVAGLLQVGVGYTGDEPRIALRLEAWLGAPNPYDAVLVEGVPRIYSRIDGGLHGDIATASLAVNAIPAVLTAEPGLRTMRDMRLPSFYGGR